MRQDTYRCDYCDFSWDVPSYLTPKQCPQCKDSNVWKDKRLETKDVFGYTYKIDKALKKDE